MLIEKLIDINNYFNSTIKILYAINAKVFKIVAANVIIN
jgi:hypothetical protein